MSKAEQLVKAIKTSLAAVEPRPAFCCPAGATTRNAAITKAIRWPPSLTVKRATAFI